MTTPDYALPITEPHTRSDTMVKGGYAFAVEVTTLASPQPDLWLQPYVYQTTVKLIRDGGSRILLRLRRSRTTEDADEYFRQFCQDVRLGKVTNEARNAS